MILIAGTVRILPEKIASARVARGG